MSASNKGNIEIPGKNVKAKRSLNRSILDQSWSEFRRQLKYKLEWLGKLLLEINPAYTSQRCMSCDHVSKENRQSQSDFCCQSCGYRANADINAAQNILAAGHAVLACGEVALAASVKQESPGKGNLLPA